MKSSPLPPHRHLTIAHLTDLSDADRSTFALSVALARASASTLVSIHASADPSAHADLPRAADLLAAWHALPRGAAPGDEARFAMQHKTVIADCCDDPVDSLLSALVDTEADLLIAATSGREGLRRLFRSSTAEAVALNIDAPSLLVPVRGHVFVSEATGKLTLRRILVAAQDAPTAEVGAAYARWFAEVAGVTDIAIELLHVTDAPEGKPPPDLVPPGANVRLVVRPRQGTLEQTILEEARLGVELIVMPTHGHDSLLDIAECSHTERVLHRALCPVLSVPLR